MRSRLWDTVQSESPGSAAGPSRLLLGGTFVFICLIWGSSWAVVRIGLATMPVLTSAGLRFVLAALLLVGLIVVRRLSLPRDAAFWRLSAFLGMVAVTIPFGLIYWGQQTVGSGLSSVLFATFPLWVAAMGRFALPDERLTAVAWFGIVLGFIGIVLISRASIRVEGVGVLWSMSAIVLSAGLQAAALIAVRKYGRAYDAELLNIVPMTMGAVILSAGGLAFEHVAPAMFTGPALLTIFYLALFGTVTTFVLYYWLAKYVEAVYLSLSAFVTPLVAVLLGIVFLGEALTLGMMAGGALVLAGILLVTKFATPAHATQEG